MNRLLIPILIIASIYLSSAARPSFTPANSNGFTTAEVYNGSPDKLGIGIRDAWKYSRGSKRVKVAVIDTGIDPEHKELRQNLWYSHGTTIYGYDFPAKKINPLDFDGHGTHVAGIIRSIADVSLMAVRFYGQEKDPMNTGHIVNAINWAIEHSASIINISGGGQGFNEEEYLAVRRAEARGILVVAAAGNEKMNLDLEGNNFYPAEYRLTNVISVASISSDGRLSRDSSYGRRSVDLAAPGEGIASTYPNGRYYFMSGTSQATAVVSGVAALMLSVNPKLSPAQIRRILMDTVEPLDSLQKNTVSGGRINAAAALKKVSKL